MNALNAPIEMCTEQFMKEKLLPILWPISLGPPETTGNVTRSKIYKYIYTMN